MAIKIYCDCCGKEADNPNFVCEMTIIEVGIDLTGGLSDPQKRMNKRMAQICHECYQKHFKELLYGKKTNKAIEGEVIK